MANTWQIQETQLTKKHVFSWCFMVSHWFWSVFMFFKGIFIVFIFKIYHGQRYDCFAHQDRCRYVLRFMDHRHDLFSGTPLDHIRRAQIRATQIRYLGVRISNLEGIRLFLMYKIAVGEKWPKNPSFRK